MRLSSIFTLLCSLAALILSFLVLFAGSKRNFLENADMLRLNVSRLGHGASDDIFNTTDGDGGFFHNIANDIEGDLNHLVSETASDIASALNLSDWYSLHILNYCEGMFSPNASLAVEGKSVSDNVMYCSPKNSMFYFNATNVLQANLPDNITLADLHWPQEIQDAENTIRVATIAMEILYIIGIVFTGIALIGAIFGIFTEGRLSACGNVILDFFAFLTLGVASGLATAIISKAVNAVNKYGVDIGVSATKGGLFLGMTWAAVALMLLALIVSFVQLIVGGHHRRRRVVTEKQVGY